MIDVPFLERAPTDASLTDYDRAHLADYLRLLDAAVDGADWREVVAIVFETDPDEAPERSRAMHDSHLERARWLSRQGYRELVWGRPASP